MVSREREEGVRILAILRDIVSVDAECRASGADAATDLLHEYSEAETLILSFALACSYEVEANESVLEAQLHALAEFAEHGLLPVFVLGRVLGVSKEALSGSALEHLEYLREVSEAE